MRIISFLTTIFNKLFGRTTIFIVIIGWFLVFTGVWMLVSAQKARKRLAGQSFGYVKWYLRIMGLFLLMLLGSLSTKISGIFSLLVLIVGIMALVKGYLFLEKIASLKIKTWVENVPIHYLRVCALIQIVIGALMLLLHRRIWF